MALVLSPDFALGVIVGMFMLTLVAFAASIGREPK